VDVVFCWLGLVRGDVQGGTGDARKGVVAPYLANAVAKPVKMRSQVVWRFWSWCEGDLDFFVGCGPWEEFVGFLTEFRYHLFKTGTRTRR
jgi:hypothetical protein